jgi:KaiC/GvpD/RAD55 family RecA-like ATPase
VVQLYHDEDFLARAVLQFLASGFAAGEAGLIIATPAHRDLFTHRLQETGIDVAKAVDRTQLILEDAECCLRQVMPNGRPDRQAFLSFVSGILGRARAAGFDGARIFGEMVNLLWDRDLEATIELEALWNAVLADEHVSLLCAYRSDNFAPDTHRGLLHQISRSHSHLIPVEDYERFEHAVDRAYADVFGTLKDSKSLRAQMLSSTPAGPDMPRAQAALLALRSVSPKLADQVLQRARHHYDGV